MKSASSFFIRHVLAWVVLFALAKFYFLIVNLHQWNDLLAFPRIWWEGLRLDLSIAGYTALLTLVCYWLVKLIRKDAVKYVKSLHWVVFVLSLIVVSTDPFFYHYWGQKANLSFLQFVGAENAGFASIVWYHYIVAAVFSVAMLVVFSKLLVDWMKPPQRLSIGASLVLLAFAFLLGRGGWMIVPINISSAFYSPTDLYNNTALNAVWNALANEVEGDANAPVVFFDSDSEAQAVWDQRSMPTTHLDSAIRRSKDMNIVVLVLESFSAKVSEKLSDMKYNAMPHVDRTMGEGICFTKAYASSFRSDKGLLSLITGMPSTARQSLTGHPQHIGRLPNLFNQLNPTHTTSFYYGGDPEFANLKLLFNKVNQTVFESDFDSDLSGPWGVHDEVVFERFYTDFEQRSEPQFSVLFSLSSHEPFDVPMEKKRTDPYLNSVEYTDSCFGVLYNKLRSSPKWNNTLLIITADHGTVRPEHSSSSSINNYQIPLILTGGAVQLDTTVNTVVSQSDISPTILEVLGLSNSFNLNSSLLQPSGHAFFSYFDGVVQVQEDTAYHYDFGRGGYINEAPPNRLLEAYYHLANSTFFTP